jgi:plastocyanin
MKQPSLIPLVLAAGALALSACGSSGTSQSGGGQGGGSTSGGSSYAPGVTNAAPPTHTVRISNQGFDPPTVTIKLNDTVAFENDDITDHTVTSTAGEHIRSGSFGKGTTYRFTPTRAGTIDYIDTLHPDMHGRIIVK